MLSNLSLNGEKLDFMLRSPFDAFVEIPKTKEWWPKLELNQRHKDFQSFALPTELFGHLFE